MPLDLHEFEKLHNDERIAAPVNFPVYHDAQSIQLVQSYLAVKEAEKQVKKLAPLVKALLKDSPKAIVGHHVITATEVAGNPGKQITQDMVGSIIGAREGYTKMEVR